MTVRCASCRAELGGDDRFCPHCGKPTRTHVAAVDRRRARERSSSGRAAIAIGIGFGVATIVPLLSLLGVSIADPEAGEGELETIAVTLQTVANLLGIGGILLCLGPGGLAETFPPLARRSAWAAAPLVAGIALSVSIAWVWLLRAAVAPSDESPESKAMSGAMILFAIAIAPVLEELLCRGALWAAVRRITGPKQTILVTSAVFALLHALNGGFFLELPHRFVVGLFLGWLRLRGNSVWPTVLAHALHNAGAVAIGA